MSDPRRTASARPGAAGAIAAGAVAAAALLLVARASRAPLAGGFGDRDLEILRRWIATGVLARLPRASDHLLKPGYLAWLRIVLGVHEPFPIRRLLVVHAALVASGIAAVAAALWKSGRRRTAAAAALALLAYVPLHDAVDYVLSEPPAAAGLLFVLALLILAESSWPAALGLGVPIALTALVRPNSGEIALLLSVLVLAGVPRAARGRIGAVLLVSLAAGAGAVGIGRARGLDVNPFGVRATNVFLWGAADYYWEEDVAPWPEAPTLAAQRHLEAARARRIWSAKLHRRSADDRRALAWKFGHAYLSCEQLPPREGSPAYRLYDRILRRWWWIAALAGAAAAAAIAVGGSGPWRFAPAFLVAAVVGQGILVGADPRLALPLVPLVWLTLLLAAPGFRASPPAAGAALLVLAAGLGLLAETPDAASSDFGVIRGSPALSFSVGPGAFAGSAEVATLHVRLLEPLQAFARGVVVEGDGRPLARYGPDPSRPAPPYLTAPIAEPLLSRARLSGLRVDLRPEGGDPGSFLYFPVVPPPWARPATIGGKRAFESGYGGVTSGGIPFWVHPGADAPLAVEGSSAR